MIFFSSNELLVKAVIVNTLRCWGDPLRMIVVVLPLEEHPSRAVCASLLHMYRYIRTCCIPCACLLGLSHGQKKVSLNVDTVRHLLSWNLLDNLCVFAPNASVVRRYVYDGASRGIQRFLPEQYGGNCARYWLGLSRPDKKSVRVRVFETLRKIVDQSLARASPLGVEREIHSAL